MGSFRLETIETVFQTRLRSCPTHSLPDVLNEERIVVQIYLEIRQSFPEQVVKDPASDRYALSSLENGLSLENGHYCNCTESHINQESTWILPIVRSELGSYAGTELGG
jgi:hypothetical protein